MTNVNEKLKPSKSKKEIKWYTYVDSDLDTKLKGFMEEYGIKNQAHVIRTFVNNSIDYIDEILHKIHPNEQKAFVEHEIDDFIRNAVETYDASNSFYEELKQKLSPLKISILMLSNYVDEIDKMLEGIDNAKIALKELENSVKRRFEEPVKYVKYVKSVDILYIEDNELERKTVDAYFKRKGVDIKSIETSDEGLYLLKTLTPRAILLDINLKTSNINGDKFCQMLKSNDQYRSIPVILISAIVTENKKKDILDNTEADDLIIKPINKLEDLEILLKYLKKK